MIKEKVSIIIPIFKNPHLLKASLKSCLDQTYKNIEILVINDGNDKDDYNKIIEIIKNFNNKKIKLINLIKNKGVSAALNLGIKNMSGSYVSWLSHDDYFHIQKIEKQINFLKKKKTKICSCNFIEKNLFKNISLKRKISPYYFHDLIFSLSLNDTLHGCTLLIKKECFDAVGLFREDLRYVQDYEMWIRLSKKFFFSHLNAYLLYSQKHINQTSVLKKKESLEEKRYFYNNIISNELVFYNYYKISFIIKFLLRSFKEKHFVNIFKLLNMYLFYRFHNIIRSY